MRYSRACSYYQDFLDRGLLLTKKLLNQGFLLVKLRSSLTKFYGPLHDLIDRYGIYVSQMTTDIFYLLSSLFSHFPVLSAFVHIDAGMVSVLTSSTVGRGFEPPSDQTKDYEIDICCFSAKDAALRRKSKDCFGIWIGMCPSGATCLSADRCIGELALYKFQLSVLSSVLTMI
jgi:hypothetical protein